MRSRKPDSAKALTAKLTGHAAEVVDEYCRLTLELQPHRANLRQVDELGKVLRAHASEYPADQQVTLIGTKSSVVAGLAAHSTVVTDKPGLFVVLGQTVFVALAGFTVTQIEQNVAPKERGRFLLTKRRGPRGLTPVPKI